MRERLDSSTKLFCPTKMKKCPQPILTVVSSWLPSPRSCQSRIRHWKLSPTHHAWLPPPCGSSCFPIVSWSRQEIMVQGTCIDRRKGNGLSVGGNFEILDKSNQYLRLRDETPDIISVDTAEGQEFSINKWKSSNPCLTFKCHFLFLLCSLITQPNHYITVIIYLWDKTNGKFNKCHHPLKKKIWVAVNVHVIIIISLHRLKCGKWTRLNLWKI